jgi:hypothetical protein
MSALARLLEAEKENASDDDDSSATTNATPQRTTRAMKRKATQQQQQQQQPATAVVQSESHLLPSTPLSTRSEKKRKSLGRRVSFSSTVDVRHFLKGALRHLAPLWSPWFDRLRLRCASVECKCQSDVTFALFSSLLLRSHHLASLLVQR